MVTTGGGVELWHASCFALREVPLVEDVGEPAAPPLARSRRAGLRLVALAAIGLVPLLAAAHWARSSGLATQIGSAANGDVDIRERLPIDTQLTAHEDAPPRVDPTEQYPVPLVNGVPLDELYPSLHEWAHPVSDTRQPMPPEACRHFGAARTGITPRPECGEGHCGVDLDGPRGQPIVAVADGTVVRVEHSELGLDHRSGRYVRIQHEDGTLTAYMHLDDIAPDIHVGDHVEAGQLLGWLGATACYKAVAHLHFSLEIPNDRNEWGDITDTHYVDPAPFLVRAAVFPAPGPRRPVDPPSS